MFSENIGGSALAGFLIGLSFFLSGLSILAVGQLISGFRDIARNSWKLNQIAEALERRSADA